MPTCRLCGRVGHPHVCPYTLRAEPVKRLLPPPAAAPAAEPAHSALNVEVAGLASDVSALLRRERSLTHNGAPASESDRVRLERLAVAEQSLASDVRELRTLVRTAENHDTFARRSGVRPHRFGGAPGRAAPPARLGAPGDGASERRRGPPPPPEPLVPQPQDGRPPLASASTARLPKKAACLQQRVRDVGHDGAKAPSGGRGGDVRSLQLCVARVGLCALLA